MKWARDWPGWGNGRGYLGGVVVGGGLGVEVRGRLGLWSNGFSEWILGCRLGS